MGRTHYDIRIRALACQKCGAPVSTAIEGGSVVCEYCGAHNVVAERRTDARAEGAASMADEVARLSRLKAQVAHPVAGHAYDLKRAPSGWASVDLGSSDGVARLESAWGRARAAGSQGGLPEAQRTLCWVVMKLAEGKRKAGEVLQARAVLETALDLLPDAGHRHLVRCKLAMDALAEDDPGSAQGWLEECDAAPEVLELDSAYRESLGWLHGARSDFERVLSIVGSREDEVPVSRELDESLTQLRAHALDRLGRADEADVQVARLCAMSGESAALLMLESVSLASGAVQRRRQARTRAIGREREVQMKDLENARARNPAGVASLSLSFMSLPFLALGLFVLVTIPRCAMDFDPYMGIHGDVLCPYVCKSCRGPLRVVTVWQQTGPGEYSSNGPQYFCPSKKNGVARMSTAQLKAQTHKLSRYELHYAPTAATYIMSMLLLLPVVLMMALFKHLHWRRRRKALDNRIEALAGLMGRPPPPPPTGVFLRRFLKLCAVIFFVACTGGLAVLIAAAELVM